MAQFYSAKRRKTTHRRLKLTAERLDAFGQGIARCEGKTVFIPGLLPGESGEIRIVEEKRRWLRGELLQRLSDSAQRVTPRCPWFGVCGGCQLQHMSVDLQQRHKAETLAALMAPVAGAHNAPDTLITGPAWGYRRRARLGLFVAPGSRTLRMGFRRQRDSQLVEIETCPVLAAPLAALIAPLRDCLQRLQGVRQLGHVELILAQQGPLVLLRHLQPLSAADRQQLTDFALAQQCAFFLAPDETRCLPLHGELPSYTVEGLHLTFSPRHFVQVNAAVNAQMIACALDWLAPHQHDHLLDLFCGMGNFTLPLAKFAGRLAGVEGMADLVAMASYNARQNRLHNTQFWQADLAQPISAQPWATHAYTKILLDPSRTGASALMPWLSEKAPQCIVYVSCNPATLARDGEILQAHGWRLDKLAMLDMFPQTRHLEAMARFVKDEAGR